MMRIFREPVAQHSTNQDLRALVSPIQPEMGGEAPAPGVPWVVVRSRLLGEDILLVCERGRIQEAEQAHPGLTTYVPREMDVLGEFVGQPETIRRLHEIKKGMRGWLVRPEG